MIFNISLIISLLLLYLFINSFPQLSNEKKNNSFLRICFFILFLVVGFRSVEAGNDTRTYLSLFNKCSIYGWNSIDIIMNYEKGYLFLNVLISYFSKNGRLFILILSFISNYSMYRFIKNNSNNYLFSVIIYICLLFFYSSMSMMRQFLALSIILFGFNFVKNKKLIKYIIIVVIASLIHSSAILGLLLYPIYNLKYTNKRTALLIIISLIIYMFLGQVFNNISLYLNKTTSYIDTLGVAKVANVLYTVVYFVIFVFSLFSLWKHKNTDHNSFYLYVTLFAFIINLLSIKISILSRASQYFTIFVIIVLPNIIHCFKMEEKSKLFINIFMCLLFIIYANTIICLRPEWNSAFNYKSCTYDYKCFF